MSIAKTKRAIQSNIRNLLRDAVKRRLISDVPIGAFLSGGIDSSAVVALMAETMDGSPNTFNISFHEKEYDESSYAELVARKFNTNHTSIRLSANHFLNELRPALKAMDSPSGDGINTYVVSKAIRQAGISVALSGLGGDELFAGYPIFNQFSRLQRYRNTWGPTYLLRKLASTLYGNGTIRKERINSILTAPSLDIESIYPISRQIISKKHILRLTNLDERNTVLEKELSAKGAAFYQFPTLSQVTCAELIGYTQQTLLKDTDQMGMAASLEIREPFFDHELVTYLLNVPDTIKAPVYPKSLLVESLKPLLPDAIVYRPKKGFSFPWDSWLKRELRGFCEERISQMAERKFINGHALKTLWQQFLTGNASVRWTELWLFIVLEEWLSDNGFE